LGYQVAGSSSGTRLALQHFAEAAFTAGELSRARDAAMSSLVLAREHAYRTGAVHALLLLAQIATREGEPGTANGYATEAASLARQLRDTDAERRALDLVQS
jgi:hypothetical protein